ncbi:FUSC family protein [Nocardioides insulae]|uniref:FUSC family protein n=1 Tax=Nocardioides insulae TaxID=394734 RepID=UPI00048EC9CF|nr:FUSC family protein [Nocardioides insulae]
MRGVIRTYLSREPGASYDWRLGLAAAIAVGVPAFLGVALHRLDAGVLTAMSAWLTMRSTPDGDTRARATSLVRRCCLMTASFALGILTGGWAALPLVALAAVAAPLRWMGPLPALCVVIGAQSPAQNVGLSTAGFLAGGLFATALLLTPYFGGRHDPPRPRDTSHGRGDLLAGTRTVLSELRGAARHGSPRFRYAVRLGVCVTAAYALIVATGLPGGELIVIGVITTLQPSWGQTTTRIVKRVVGTILGSVLAVFLLVLASGHSAYAVVITIAILSSLGQPLRKINYGFWPVFSAPVALLLSDTSGTVGWQEALERSTYTAVGALIAAVATLVIWPPREEERVPDHLSAVLEAHARMLRRTAAVLAQPGPPTERLHTRAAAESASRELREASRFLALRRQTPQALVDSLNQVGLHAQSLREAALAAINRPAAASPDALAELAVQLSSAAEHLEVGLPEDFATSAAPDAPDAAEQAARACAMLIDDTAHAARLALSLPVDG